MTDAARAFGEATQLKLTLDEATNLGRSCVEEWSRHVHPIPGVTELIRQLARTLTVAVVSNTHDSEMVPTMLSAVGVSYDISIVVLSVDHGWLKPHPSIYTEALERVGCAAEDAVFVGDSLEADYLGPLDVGMRALLIDPAKAHGVPASARLTSALDIVTRIGDR
jgi:putative hydrolase of the HAD superfamily